MTDTAPRDSAAPAAAPEPAAPPPERPRERRLTRLAELLALTGFAVTQPVLDVTGRSPDFFLFRQPTAAEMWLLLAVVALLPPLVLWLGEVAVGLVSRTAERALHLLNLAGLLTIIVVQVAKQGGHFGRRPAAVALVAGCALAVLLARVPALRQVLRYAAPAPFVFVLVFALTAPAGALVRPARAGSSAGPATGTKPPIVVLFLDEFPTRAMLDADGRVDKRLFPNLARLAAESTWYPNATAVAGYTPYAIPAMLSGTFPEARLAPAYVEYPDNLFSLLGEQYQVNAFESISQLCSPRFCTDAPAGRETGFRPLLADTLEIATEVVSPRKPKPREGEDFAEQVADPNAAPAKGELKPGFKLKEGAKNQPERVTSFLAAVERPAVDKPALNFLHLLLPHIPHRYLPSGTTYSEHPPTFPLSRAKEGDNFRRNEHLGAVQVFQQRMLLQLAYTDTLVGELIDRMKKAGTWDDAVVVLTADHGAGVTPGQKSRLLDTGNAADLTYVPLFVKTPGQTEGKVDERNAMTVDVLPTVADVLDVRVPFEVDGVSLLAAPRPDQTKRWFDDPGEPLTVDGAKWAAAVRRGYAPDLVRPDLGPDGIFAIGPHRALYGKKLAELTVGAPAPVTATSKHPKGFGAVSLASGSVPGMVWGDLDRSPGGTEQWLAVSVNGSVAGFAYAAPSRQAGTWHFVGMVADRFFVDGRNDVRLHVVQGSTLHPVRWAGG